MAINDLIFRELVKRGPENRPEARIWHLEDSKLWYVTPEQAQGFLELWASPEYSEALTAAEIELIGHNLGTIASKLPEQRYNLVDLGCGNGEKAAIFIEQIKGRLGVRYCPVDISSYMVERALETVGRLDVDSIVESRDNISDFENLANVMPAFRRGGYNGSLILLLGNTIGNFDREDILEGIYQSMEPQDYLLIGTELRNGQRVDEILKEYDSEAVDDFLSHLPRKAGLDDGNVEFEAEFNQDRVELYYRVLQGQTVVHLGKQIEFMAGDRIWAAISYKYTSDELKELLEKRFDTEIYMNEPRNYALALCSRK
jgi:uncharacterized SAM-dependent methyltransferase